MNTKSTNPPRFLSDGCRVMLPANAGRADCYDSLEVAPILPLDKKGEIVEQVTDLDRLTKAERARVFYSIFGHQIDHGVECLGDFRTYNECLDVIQKLTGIDCTPHREPKPTT